MCLSAQTHTYTHLQAWMLEGQEGIVDGCLCRECEEAECLWETESQTLRVPCLSQSPRRKAFDQIELWSSCKNRKERESMIHVTEGWIALHTYSVLLYYKRGCTVCDGPPVLISQPQHRLRQLDGFAEGSAVTKTTTDSKNSKAAASWLVCDLVRQLR